MPIILQLFVKHSTQEPIPLQWLNNDLPGVLLASPTDESPRSDLSYLDKKN